ncbi:MAG: phosphohydrolase [Symbiobacteriaceae bacterium]|nr:phosphohydrolase [Symbiobacteriaceae bacterium]
MLSRRNFMKAIASALVAAAGGTALWLAWRKRGSAAGTGPREQPPGPSPSLSLWLLSDIHMTEMLESKLHLALKDVTRFDPPADAIVFGGDQVEGGRESDYALLRQVLSGYKLPPTYGLMGNHEYYHIWYDAQGNWTTANGPNAGKTDAQARERFLQFMGYERPWRDAWVGGVHLIMLSQEAYVQERPEVGEGAWYSDEQMAWLKETLKPHADGKPALVFIHQPLPPDGQDGGTHRLIRAKEFRSTLAPYRNVFVFSGHTHRNLETEGRYVRDTTFHWFNNASVGKTRGGSLVSSPVQGMYVQVYPDRVVVRGREFSNATWIGVAEWTVPLT